MLPESTEVSTWFSFLVNIVSSSYRVQYVVRVLKPSELPSKAALVNIHSTHDAEAGFELQPLCLHNTKATSLSF